MDLNWFIKWRHLPQCIMLFLGLNLKIYVTKSGGVKAGYRERHACCSVTQQCLTLCSPMDCSTPGFPVLHLLPEPAQTHVHWVGDAIQPSHPLSSPSPLHQSFPASGPFPMSQLFASGDQSIGASASASVLPMNIQHWFPFGLTALISLLSMGLSGVFFSSTVLWCSAFCMIQFSYLYMITGKIIALTIQIFVGKVMSLLFNTLSRFP